MVFLFIFRRCSYAHLLDFHVSMHRQQMHGLIQMCQQIKKKRRQAQVWRSEIWLSQCVICINGTCQSIV